MSLAPDEVLPTADLIERPFRIPSAYDSPQLLEFVFGLEPDVADEAFKQVYRGDLDFMLARTVRFLRRCPKRQRPSEGPPTGPPSMIGADMIPSTVPLPLMYEDYLDGEMDRMGLSRPTQNLLHHIARKVGPQKFDLFVALTGYATERYTYLGYLDGIIYTNLTKRRLKAKAREKPMSDEKLNFRRGIIVSPFLVAPDNAIVDHSMPVGTSCPRGTRVSTTLADVLAKGTREARDSHALADIHRSLAWDHKARTRAQEAEARQEARARRIAEQR